MKKMLKTARKGFTPLAGVLLLGLLFTACKKDNNSNTETPAAGLMSFNLSADKAIGISLGNGNLNNVPLNYTSYTGAYQPVFPGTRTVESFDFYTGSSIATASQNFEVNKYYSLFTVGANGHYRNVVVEDELDSIPTTSGNAFVRFVNGIVDSVSTPAVKITSGATVIDNTAAYATVSGFKSVAPGDITLSVSNGGSISATRTFAVEKDRVYTVLLVGVPGDSDPAKAVQIKFISNGTVAP